MKRKYIFYIAIASSILSLSACSSEKTPKADTNVEIETPTKEAVQTNEEPVTEQPANDPVTEPAAGDDKNSSDFGFEDEVKLLNQFTNQTIIPIKSDGSVWNSKELLTLLKAGKIVEIANDTELVTDIMEPIKINYEFQKDTDNPEDFTKYTLTVNSCTYSENTTPLLDKVYMASLNGGNSYQLIVQEYGYDVYTQLHIFSYDDSNQTLNQIGTIPGNVIDLKVCEDGTFTAEKSASCVETWWYDQRYMISQVGYNVASDVQIPEVVVQMPPEMHPVGTQVVTKMPLSLLSDQHDSNPTITIPSGTSLVLCSCDDANWLYVSTIADTPDTPVFSGYIRLSGTDSIIIDGNKVLCTDAFDNLFFAG